MKKLLLIITIAFSFIWTTSATQIDLDTCSSYYDGCNTCSVIWGKIWACTERVCFHQDEPKCLVEKTSNESTQEIFCKNYDWILESQWDVCTFGNQQIDINTLYNSYLDFSGEMMYLGWSKYFDESTGFYDYNAVRSDLNTLWFVKLHIAKLYKEYQSEINTKMDSLQAKLDSQNEVRIGFVWKLWDKLVDRIDDAVVSFLWKTANMSHAKKEIYLIKKVEILSNIRDKYEAQSNTSEDIFHIIDYFIYKFERYIAYE